jgi:hypothetical protein
MAALSAKKLSGSRAKKPNQYLFYKISQQHIKK